MEKGASVSLVVSTGPAVVQRTVPNIVGMTETAAKTALTASGLSFTSVTEQNSDTVAAGVVLSQNPGAGTVLADGSSVDFVVSLGPAAPATYGGIFTISAPPEYQEGTTAELVVTAADTNAVLYSGSATSFPHTVTGTGATVAKGTLTVSYKVTETVSFQDDEGVEQTRVKETPKAVYQELTFTPQ